jgi:hypothetical protein
MHTCTRQALFKAVDGRKTGAGSVPYPLFAAAAPPVLSAVCEWHLTSRLFSPHAPRVVSSPEHRARRWGPQASELRPHLPLHLPVAGCLGCARRLGHAPYSRGAGSKREHAVRTLARMILSPGGGPSGLRVRVGVGPGGTEAARLRCGPAAITGVAVRRGAAGQAPLAVWRTRVPRGPGLRLDGQRCCSGAARFESRGPWLEVATAVQRRFLRSWPDRPRRVSARHAAQATAPGRHIRGIVTVLGRHHDSRSVWLLSGV